MNEIATNVSTYFPVLNTIHYTTPSKNSSIWQRSGPCLGGEKSGSGLWNNPFFRYDPDGARYFILNYGLAYWVVVGPSAKFLHGTHNLENF